MEDEAVPATVADLVAHLLTLPQHLPVAYQRHSEQCLLELNDVRVEQFCEARPDGWVQNKRPDMPAVSYVLFPGN
jgi:hypothetical protein